MIESLSDAGDQTDAPHQSPELTVNLLQAFLDPPTRPDSAGRLSHYDLLEVLGQGGYGIVFKAFDTKLNRLVAIKILLPHLATSSPPRRRFLREARAAAAVRHEHVVQIYAVEESPLPYLVMEFISGETLQQRSDRIGPFDTNEVIRLGQQIARGLAAAHDQSLIHRDIKPCNILITDDIVSVAKLSDFGLARTVDDASLSQSGIIIGTPMYMSPEQVAGSEVDQRTDLFSLGSVLYLMAAGRPPFRATSTLAVLKRVADDKPRSIRDVISDVPEGLCDLIMRLHAKSREQRFSTAKDVEAALATCLTTPPRTWWRRLARFSANRPGRIASLVAILLMLSISGLLLGESAGVIHLFPRVADAARDDITQPTAKVTAPPTLLANSAVAAPEPANSAAPAVHTEASPTEKTAVSPVAPLEQASPLSVDDVVLTDWEKSVGLLTPVEQAAAVTAKFKELNPGFSADGALHFSYVPGAIDQLRIQPAHQVQDLSPIRPLRKLTRVRILEGGLFEDISALQGLPLEHLEIVGPQVRDLTPLKGMKLQYIGIWPFSGSDLSPLRGMQLKGGNLGGGQILQDLEPLRGMPIEEFCLNHTSVSDLSPLKGMPLRRLQIQNTHVRDLTPIVGAPLEYLGASYTKITDLAPLKTFEKLVDLDIDYEADRDKAILEALPLLKSVNGRPLAEFLASP